MPGFVPRAGPTPAVRDHQSRLGPPPTCPAAPHARRLSLRHPCPLHRPPPGPPQARCTDLRLAPPPARCTDLRLSPPPAAAPPLVASCRASPARRDILRLACPRR
ncbi:hypothetical protein GCM10018954_082820 [Kutzneria kofuensis]